MPDRRKRRPAPVKRKARRRTAATRPRSKLSAAISVTDAAYQATAEVLRLISEWQRDPQPVFDVIVQMSTRLCEANYGFLMRYDGTMLSVAAQSDATSAEMQAVLQTYPQLVSHEGITGRTVLDGRVVQIRDIQTDRTCGHAMFQRAGWRTGLGVPLLLRGVPIGALVMWRRKARPFNQRHVELLRTFADQAVIAIETVRLFTELEGRRSFARSAGRRSTCS
jgi:two-component system NtrC family sensor kinase